MKKRAAAPPPDAPDAAEPATRGGAAVLAAAAALPAWLGDAATCEVLAPLSQLASDSSVCCCPKLLSSLLASGQPPGSPAAVAAAAAAEYSAALLADKLRLLDVRSLLPEGQPDISLVPDEWQVRPAAAAADRPPACEASPLCCCSRLWLWPMGGLGFAAALPVPVMLPPCCLRRLRACKADLALRTSGFSTPVASARSIAACSLVTFCREMLSAEAKETKEKKTKVMSAGGTQAPAAGLWHVGQL